MSELRGGKCTHKYKSNKSCWVQLDSNKSSFLSEIHLHHSDFGSFFAERNWDCIDTLKESVNAIQVALGKKALQRRFPSASMGYRAMSWLCSFSRWVAQGMHSWSNRLHIFLFGVIECFSGISAYCNISLLSQNHRFRWSYCSWGFQWLEICSEGREDGCGRSVASIESADQKDWMGGERTEVLKCCRC